MRSGLLSFGIALIIIGGIIYSIVITSLNGISFGFGGAEKRTVTRATPANKIAIYSKPLRLQLDAIFHLISSLPDPPVLYQK